MEHCADANFGLDAISNEGSPEQALGWSSWSEMGVSVKRSITWNGFPTNRRRRTASPNFCDDIDDTLESDPWPNPSCGSPSMASQADSGSIISNSSPDSYHDNQSIPSRPKSFTSPHSISDDIFEEVGDTISIPSPDHRAEESQVESRTSQRSDDIFSSMDVTYDTQSVDMFSDCESIVYFTAQRTVSPELFDDSECSRSECVGDPLENGEIVDLTQDENDIPEQNQNGAEDPQEENEDAADATVQNGDDNSPMLPHAQLVVAETRLRMESDPNILLERFLGSRFVNNDAPPVPDRLNDDTTTVFSGDDVSGPNICDEAKQMLRKIERLIADTLTKLSEGKRLELTVRSRTNWSNCTFEDDIFTLLPLNQAKCRRIRSTYWLSLIFYLLAEIYEMISMKRTCTMRELYYSDLIITEKQENVNEALKLICCKLEVSPWQLGVLSSTKGLLAGKMKIVMTENVVIDCSLHIDGILLPQCIADIERMTTDAKYVLLVEKDTVFKKLVKFNISEYFGTECILITGKGYPDTSTRLMLKKIWDLHKLPIYALTDADPHGIEIMLTYRHGSLAMSNISDALAVPSIRWIGILPSDIQKFGIKSIQMTREDRRKMDNLMNRPGLSDAVYRELQCLQRTNEKAEIEGLSGSSSHYLIDVYLRNQFENKISI